MAEVLTTDNEERNRGIRELNAALGYQRTGGELRLIRPGGDDHDAQARHDTIT